MLKMIRRLLQTAHNYKGRIYTAFVFSFLKSLLHNAPIFLGYFVISRFLSHTVTPSFCLMIGIIMVAMVAVQCLFQHLADRLQSGAGFELFADMRMQLGEHLRHLPMGYFTEGAIGKISSVLSTDMVFIEENCMMAIADMMNYLFSQLILVIMLFFFHPLAGLLSAIICLAMILFGKKLTNDALSHSVIRQQQSEKLTDAVLDFAEGIGIIKSYNLLGQRQQALTENFKRTCRTSLDFEEEHAKNARIMYLIWGVGTVAELALCLGLYFASAIPIDYFIGIMLFIFSLFFPLKSFYSQIARLTVMDSCLTRIEEVFDEAQMDDNGVKHLPAENETDKPEVEYQNVHFSYGDKEVLHGISFAVHPSEMLALVGPSGGGKSTIGSLLARLWDVNDGKILLRGVDIRDVPLSELMRQISIVFQRVYLFQDTVYNNIIMGRPEASKEEVIQAAKKARCHEFIMNLPNGYDTVIGEGGATLSGGEMQRISIARCILKDTPVIILDEATASIDADNELAIQQAISELVRGKTLVVIAHRLHTIRDANQILVISDGTIAEQGTHEELLAKEGIYRSMVQKRYMQ